MKMGMAAERGTMKMTNVEMTMKRTTRLRRAIVESAVHSRESRQLFSSQNAKAFTESKKGVATKRRSQGWGSGLADHYPFPASTFFLEDCEYVGTRTATGVNSTAKSTTPVRQSRRQVGDGDVEACHDRLIPILSDRVARILPGVEETRGRVQNLQKILVGRDETVAEQMPSIRDSHLVELGAHISLMGPHCRTLPPSSHISELNDHNAEEDNNLWSSSIQKLWRASFVFVF